MCTTCKRSQTCSNTTPTKHNANRATARFCRLRCLRAARSGRPPFRAVAFLTWTLAALAIKPLDSLHRPQPSGTCARIDANLLGGWHHRPLGEQLDFPAPATLADGRSRKTETIAVPLAKSRFYQSIL